MVLKPAVTRLAAMAAIAQEPVAFGRERYAAAGNRTRRLKTDLPYLHSFAHLSAGAAETPGQPIHASRPSFPPPISDIHTVEDSGAIEELRDCEPDDDPQMGQVRFEGYQSGILARAISLSFCPSSFASSGNRFFHVFA